jgi:hypothetical protein
MPRNPGWIEIDQAREILGDCADVEELANQLIVAKRVGTDGTVTVDEADVRNMARVLNKSAVRSPRRH